MFRRFKLFLLALFCFSPDALHAREREINTSQDFKYLVQMEDWRAHLSWVRSIDDTPKWVKKTKGKFEDSLVDYIPQKLAELATYTGVFAVLDPNYGSERPEYLTFSDKFDNFAPQNWNSFVFLNLVSALYSDTYKYEYEDCRNELSSAEQEVENVWQEEGIGVKLVGIRLKNKLEHKYDEAIDKAVSDISIYAKALHLYNYIHDMVKFRNEEQGGNNLPPNSSNCCFNERNKSGDFEISGAMISYGKKKVREGIHGKVENGKFTGYSVYNNEISTFVLGKNKEESADLFNLDMPIITIDRDMRIIPLKSSDAKQGDEISVEEDEEDEGEINTSLNESLQKRSIDDEDEKIELDEENSDYEHKIIWKELFFSDQLQENSLNRRHISADYENAFLRLFCEIFEGIECGGKVNNESFYECIREDVPVLVGKVCESKAKCIKGELSSKVQYLYELLDGNENNQKKIEDLLKDIPDDPNLDNPNLDEPMGGFNNFKLKAIGALDELKKLNQEKLFVDDGDTIADINDALDKTKDKLSSINLPATLPAFASDLAQGKKDIRVILELLNSADGTEIAQVLMDYLSRVERIHRCEKCTKENKTEEDTFVLPVPTKHETIQECISVADTIYNRPICPACKSEQECTTKFLNLPKMLLVRLDRNEPDQKLLEGFYKEKLFLSDKNGEKEYNLAAVIRTQPDDNKLYDIRVKNSDGKWYNISSSGNVSQSNFAFDENAYLLFYDQVD
ncbi:MAG: hypothetical protein IJT08_02090 [Alphaproteobacteria bacterium]|nr:hypothetical protein [Alphaproteobacteria bacterium]